MREKLEIKLKLGVAWSELFSTAGCYQSWKKAAEWRRIVEICGGGLFGDCCRRRWQSRVSIRREGDGAGVIAENAQASVCRRARGKKLKKLRAKLLEA